MEDKVPVLAVVSSLNKGILSLVASFFGAGLCRRGGTGYTLESGLQSPTVSAHAGPLKVSPSLAILPPTSDSTPLSQHNPLTLLSTLTMLCTPSPTQSYFPNLPQVPKKVAPSCTPTFLGLWGVGLGLVFPSAPCSRFFSCPTKPGPPWLGYQLALNVPRP